MLGSIISFESFIELFNHSATDLHSLLVKITSHSAVQGINGLDLFGEILFNNLAFVILTKWKPLLFISTMAFCTFRLLQKTFKKVEVRPVKRAFSLSRLFKMVKNAHLPGVTGDIISLIEKHNIDVNSKHPKSESGLSLFLCACLSGDSSLVTYMLSKGADINSNTTCKDGALHLASFCCAKQNIKKGLGIITSLYQAGCNINSKNWLGNTPLCIAASSGNCDLIQHLISLGGDKNICNNDGIYAMDFATNAGHLDAAKLLAIDVPNPHVWDIVDPHTPPRVKLGLQSPSKQHLVYSSFRKRRLDFCSLVK
ncbi:hypothetical protein ABFA07_000926 [Porites harrisoni]